MANKLRDRMESQKLRETKFIETQKLKREVGPTLWEEILNRISIEGTALNEEMGQDVITVGKPNFSGELVLIANMEDGVRRSNIRLEVELGRLTWKNENGLGDRRELAIGLDGKMAFHSGMISSTPDSIARQILENLLD
jgi:hypothetical protein